MTALVNNDNNLSPCGHCRRNTKHLLDQVRTSTQLKQYDAQRPNVLLGCCHDGVLSTHWAPTLSSGQKCSLQLGGHVCFRVFFRAQRPDLGRCVEVNQFPDLAHARNVPGLDVAVQKACVAVQVLNALRHRLDDLPDLVV